MTERKRGGSARSPVCIVGGGAIGLGIGWRLARKGAAVEVFDRDTAGRGASWAAAGMLAPLSEVGFEDEGFLALGRESLRLYPQFLEELKEDAGVEVRLGAQGTLIIGLDRDDAERLRRLCDFREHLGLPVKWLSGTEAREIEPLVSPRTSSAIWIPDDHQVDNRGLVEALKTALRKCGGTLHENRPVAAVLNDEGRVRGVRTEDGDIDAACVVIAAGCWSKQIGGIPKELLPPVRPVKGQTLTLTEVELYSFSHVIRAPDAYLVTNRALCAAGSLETVVGQACGAGVRAVQLREKDLSGGDLHSLAVTMREVTRRTEAGLFINDRADIALGVGADGIHCTQSGLPVDVARRLCPEALVGASSHSLERVAEAARAGADFVLFGPVFPTPSKAKYGAPQGLDALSVVARGVGVPVFAIGGVTPENAPLCLEKGAAGVGVVSAILAASDVPAAVEAFRRSLGGL